MGSKTPAFSSVKDWDTVYESDLVKVEVAYALVHQNSAGRYVVTTEESYRAFQADFWKVTPAGKTPKKFFGETAWMDARRVASDFDFQAWSI